MKSMLGETIGLLVYNNYDIRLVKNIFVNDHSSWFSSLHGNKQLL